MRPTKLRLRTTLFALLLGCQSGALAQNAPFLDDARVNQSHQEVAASLIAQCVLASSPATEAFAVARPGDLMSADPSVLGTLRAAGRSITVAPWNTEESAVPIIRYQLETGTVSQEKSSKRRIRRTIFVRVAYTSLSNDRSVLDASVCERSHEDEISRKRAGEWSASSSGIPLVVSPLPRDGLFKRVIRPAVAVAATSVSLYLLFSLRSERQNDAQ